MREEENLENLNEDEKSDMILKSFWKCPRLPDLF